MTDIPEEEKVRRALFAGLVNDQYLPERPEHTQMYAPAGKGKLPFVCLPDEQGRPVRKLAFLPERTKFRDGPIC